MSAKGKVVRIDFYTKKTLPDRLKQLASEQGTSLGEGLISVKTMVSSPPTYEFEVVGSKPAQIQTYMEKLAKIDGAELGTAVQKALSED